MQLITALVGPLAALSFCPADFTQNATMAEGPCSDRPSSVVAAAATAAAISPPAAKEPLSSTVFISNGTAVEVVADLRLWNDMALTGLEAVVPPTSYGAISIVGAGAAGKRRDLGFYVPVSSGVDGTCLKKKTL